MTATAKQHAGNNPTLARVKQAFNGRIYQLVMDTYNARGREAARAELARFYNTTGSAQAALAAIFDGE